VSHPLEPYCPGDLASWARLAPAEAGFDPDALAAAVAFAQARESDWPRSLYYPDGRYVGIVEWNESGPWSEVAGPPRSRTGPATSLHGPLSFHSTIPT